MSLRAIVWAFQQIAVKRSPSTSASLVLLKIADRANDDGVCWPGRKRLGLDIALSEETVRQCVRKLERAGLVIVERRQDSAGRDIPNKYHLPIGEGLDLTTPLVKAGVGSLQNCPKPNLHNKNITTSSNKRGGAGAPRSLDGGDEKKNIRRGVWQEEVDKETGIHYQQGNEDDKKLLLEIRRHNAPLIAAAVRKASGLDRKGRAWPSAVWKILRLQAMSTNNVGSGPPPAWAVGDADPPAVAAAGVIEGTYTTMGN